MLTPRIPCSPGGKFVTLKSALVTTPISGYDVRLPHLWLSVNGTLSIRQGFLFDGPSIPSVTEFELSSYETETALTASAIHDAFYLLMQAGKIPWKECKPVADQLFHDILIEHGMNPVQAALWHAAVKVGGDARPLSERPVQSPGAWPKDMA